MIKKEYLKPTMGVCQADTEVQILAGSVTDIITTGLGDDLDLDDTGDSWDDALVRGNNIWDDSNGSW